MAIPVAELEDGEARLQILDALFEGYTEFRAMPKSQWRHLDLFICAWHATALLYAINAWLAHPMFRVGAERWREQQGQYLIQALARLGE
jgi:Ser/Thr protein kinase RdoA (MazF antagonist)